MKFLLPALLLLISTNLRAADVEVTVQGVTQARGTLLVGFFTNASDFRVREIPESPKVVITKAGPVITTVKNLKPGIYAVAVIWDLNNNGVLDTKGRFKIPVEPYGFSNNPKSRFGPPAFELCTIQVPENGGKVRIFLK